MAVMEKGINNTHTIFKVDVVEGETTADVDQLAQLVLQNSHELISSDPSHTESEDCKCPDSPILHKIVDDIQSYTSVKLEVISYWGHVHEKNMSTNKHTHRPADLSAVVYLKVPPKSGQIVFWPTNDYRYTIPPQKGRFLLFPSWIEHHVTRNLSEEPRVSVSLNFKVTSEEK